MGPCTMYIVYCSDNPSFASNALKVRAYADQFPGAGWVHCLYRLAKEHGLEMVSGDLALNKVIKKEWQPSNILVIQEMDSSVGTRLVQLGANPFVLVCFEAPLYAPLFYDKKETFIAQFKHKLGFGLLKDQFTFPASVAQLKFAFPSYYLNEDLKFHTWSDRKSIVLVAGNKYFSIKNILHIPINPIGILRAVKRWLLFLASNSYKKSLQLSLHDKRLELIEYFLEKGWLTIFGSGWNDLSNLPSDWRRRLLKKNIAANYMGSCKNKQETISDFKFSLCCENIESPGYITEKIIDCFLAGTIPIYLGANDISIHFPSYCFINARNFSSLDLLSEYLEGINDDEAKKMVECGRRFLRSASAKLYSYEGFSSSVMELIKK
ncbi:hypothetical protein G6688_01660 [Polynucleobacter paneuropaeus]|nr:hypothetical protein G6688_01660 [Polynucleobacter paneuropaeus]